MPENPRSSHYAGNVPLTVPAILDPESMAGLAYLALGPLAPDMGSCRYDACESDEACTCQEPVE